MDKNIQAGTIIGGKYVVEKVIGSGGMGVVVKARQTGLDRLVAIKVLLSTHRERSDFVERFYREAKAAARVRGDHIAQVFDVGRTEDGDPYMAMEFLEGEDLSRVLKREGRLPLKQAITYMLHACAGVAEAHHARVVHRDLKPANFFLATSQGKTTLKVIDFGISKVEETASALTSTGSALGTAFYMAPEQIERPKTVDARLDIWALGVIFFELVTGDIPFGGESLAQVVASILRNERRKARAYVPDLPPRVDAIIDRCLQSAPERRYATATELGDAIAQLLGPGIDEQGELVPELPIASRDAMNATVAVPRSQPEAGAAPVRTAMMEIDSLDLGDAPSLELDFGPGSARGMPAHYGGAHSSQRLPASSSQRLPPSSSPAVAAAWDRPSWNGPSSHGVPAHQRPRQTGDPLQRSLATAEHSPRKKSPVVGIAVGLVIIGVLGAGGAVVAMPMLATSALHTRAQECGLTLSHDSGSFSLGGVDVTNVQLETDALPGTTIHAAKAHATASGQDVVMRDVEIVSQGSLDDFSRVTHAAAGSFPKSLRMEQVHLSHALASDLTLEAFDGTITSKPGGEGRMSLTSPRAILHTPAGGVGPFAIALDQTSATDTTLKLSATDTSGAALTITWSGATTTISAQLPRGIYLLPAKAYGLSTEDSLDLAAKVDATIDASGTLTGGGTVFLSHVKAGSSTLDLASSFTLKGTADKVVLDGDRARIGPFSGNVHAQWAKTEDRSAYFTFRTYPTACKDVARARAKDGPVSAVLADIVQYAGIAKVDGTAAASGVVELALRSPPTLSTSLSKNDTCGLTVFPAK